MKEILNFFKKNPMLVVFLFIALVLFPTSIGTISESYKKSIVVAMAVDQDSDGITLSIMSFVPKAETGFTENYKIIAAKGSTIALATDKAGLELGKSVVFGHTSTVIIGESIASENAVAILDYIIRHISLSKETYLLFTNVKASETLAAVQKMSTESNLSVNELVQNNGKYIGAKECSIEDLFAGYYSRTQTSLVSILELSDNPEIGIVVSSDEPASTGGEEGGGESGGGEGGSGGDSAKKVLINTGKTVVLKNGKLVSELSEEAIRGVSWVQNGEIEGVVQAGDNITYSVRGRSVRGRASFINGRPIITYNIDLKLHLEEAIGLESTYGDNLFSKEVGIAIEQNVKRDYMKALSIAREKNADFLYIDNLFFKQCRGKWLEFLELLPDGESYLNHVKIEISVNSVAV